MPSISIDIIDSDYVDTLRLNNFSFKEIATRFLGISRASFLRWRCRTNYVDPLDYTGFFIRFDVVIFQFDCLKT